MSLEEAVRKLGEQVQKQELERQGKLIQDFHIKIQSAAFSSAQAYTNIVIGLGYASFFWLWANIKDRLPDFWMLLSVLTMTISIVAFVQFEIVKMIAHSRHFMGIRRVVTLPPAKALDAQKEFERESDRRMIMFVPYWIATLIICLITGITGIGILIVHMIIKLLPVMKLPPA